MTFTFLWASLIAQLVKKQHAMKDTPVRFLGQEDLLEKGAAVRTTHLLNQEGCQGWGQKLRQWPSGSGRLLDYPEDEEVLLQQEKPRLPLHWHLNFPEGSRLEGERQEITACV